MGGHTAMLVAARHPELVDRLVLLETTCAGEPDDQAAAQLGAWFASWPAPFPDAAAAASFLGDGPLPRAWIAELEATPDGPRPRFGADVMERILRAVHAPRWSEWASIRIPATAVFAASSMFTAEQIEEFIAARPTTMRIDLDSGSHDAHLDAFEEWVAALRTELMSPAPAV